MSGQSSLPTYSERVEQFRKVRLRLLNMLYELSPARFTTEDLAKRYLEKYKHLPDVGRRLRELRASGLIKSAPDGRRVMWGLTEDWKTQ